jgi:hypothetical protein
MYKPVPTSSVFDPPFALDTILMLNTTRSTTSINSNSSTDTTTGYRSGGPKEARLRRVAPLSPTKNVEHLYPLKLENIPRDISTAKLQTKLTSLGEISDIYIPKNLETMQPARDFAVVRFADKKSAMKAIELAQRNDVNIEGSPVKLTPLKKQESLFTQGTGYLGITNEAYDDGTRHRKKEVVKQDVPLAECLAISGYPWGSKRELKFLPPHANTDTYEMYSLKITNLAEDVTYVLNIYF